MPNQSFTARTLWPIKKNIFTFALVYLMVYIFVIMHGRVVREIFKRVADSIRIQEYRSTTTATSTSMWDRFALYSLCWLGPPLHPLLPMFVDVARRPEEPLKRVGPTRKARGLIFLVGSRLVEYTRGKRGEAKKTTFFQELMRARYKSLLQGGE